MRTTLAIDDDVLIRVKRLAADRSMSLGKMTSLLLRRALEADCPTREVNDLIVLDPGSRSALVTSSTVRNLVEDHG